MENSSQIYRCSDDHSVTIGGIDGVFKIFNLLIAVAHGRQNLSDFGIG